ncbi:Fic family protein [Pseudomonas sp. EpS/L25]|uniref:Fic family protein n=1 Tax=Pseudomonas sp. EpS/L25 TaxID=1749078 RepID=UPI0007434909|nr:Fic family protein [Pseudomonas sp. EpS/L25]KUM39467.1 addiction module protein [Pseudomonas sp. EpS/L25]
MAYFPPQLPLAEDLESRTVLRKLARAHQALAELKGVADSVPNQDILISTLSLQEAKDSSAIENIITTQDDLYRSDSAGRQFISVAAKEVHNYALALKEGFLEVRRTGLLTNSDILRIQARLEENEAGFRRMSGTKLMDQAGLVVYTPPQHPDEVIALMTNLERFINDETLCDWDPLTRMAVMHHQFESIHPFYDGNGRTGRILNVLYLVRWGLLGSPVLYLSRYINQNKALYYSRLQAVRDEGAWEAWLLFMLEAVEQTATQTTKLIYGIKDLMQDYKERLRTQRPKIYSQDLLNNLFWHPYTKVEFVQQELNVSRPTATKYLETVVELGLLSKHRVGKENLYLNDALFELLSNAAQREYV